MQNNNGPCIVDVHKGREVDKAISDNFEHLLWMTMPFLVNLHQLRVLRTAIMTQMSNFYRTTEIHCILTMVMYQHLRIFDRNLHLASYHEAGFGCRNEGGKRRELLKIKDRCDCQFYGTYVFTPQRLWHHWQQDVTKKASSVFKQQNHQSSFILYHITLPAGAEVSCTYIMQNHTNYIYTRLRTQFKCHLNVCHIAAKYSSYHLLLPY